jgi:hypothetical protein
MKVLPTTLGAEPKKLAVLGGLVVLLGVVYWMNSAPDVPAGQTKAPRPAAKTAPQLEVPKETSSPATAPRGPRVATRTGTDDWQPSIKWPEGLDPSTVDPRIKYDVLTKVRSVGEAGGKRSLFEFYNPPPPPPPVAKIKPEDIKPPVAVVKADPGPAKPPPPPPIPIKFYGYSGRPGDAVRRAFFVDGEEIFIKAENDLIRDRYKIVRINVNSAEVEDTVSKNRQTLQIIEQMDR